MIEAGPNSIKGECSRPTSSDGRRLRTHTLNIPVAPDLDNEMPSLVEAQVEDAGRGLLGFYFDWTRRLRGRLGRSVLRVVEPEILEPSHQSNSISEAPSRDLPTSPQENVLPPFRQEEVESAVQPVMMESVLALDDALECQAEEGTRELYESTANYLLPGSHFDPFALSTFADTPIFYSLLRDYIDNAQARWYRGPLPVSSETIV